MEVVRVVGKFFLCMLGDWVCMCIGGDKGERETEERKRENEGGKRRMGTPRCERNNAHTLCPLTQ